MRLVLLPLFTCNRTSRPALFVDRFDSCLAAFSIVSLLVLPHELHIPRIRFHDFSISIHPSADFASDISLVYLYHSDPSVP